MQRLTLKIKLETIIIFDIVKLTDRLASVSLDLDSIRDQFVAAERRLAEYALESKQKDNLLEQLSTSNEEMQDRLRRRGDECDRLVLLSIIYISVFEKFVLIRLREELKAQSSEMIGLQHRLNDSQISITELQTKQMPLQLELTKFKREKEYLEQQLNILQQESLRRNEEDRKYRTETTQKLFMLESKLSECQLELGEKSKEASMVKVCSMVNLIWIRLELLFYIGRINFKFSRIARTLS